MSTLEQQLNSDIAIDALSADDAMLRMIDSHIASLNAAKGALNEISRAARLVSDAFEAGNTVFYGAAGSSGLMAHADACELSGTFGIPQSQIRICMAGGVPVDGHMPGGTEDAEADAVDAAKAVQKGDVAIVVSASGSTPYAVGFAGAASKNGAQVIGIANVDGSALLQISDVAIALGTTPEVIEGSTRLGAGTSQKVALNMISTQAGILMGHVHDGLMVNLQPENTKLRRRAAHIVSRIASVSGVEARRVLQETAYDTKLATLVALGNSPAASEKLLERHRGRLRSCLHDVAGQSEKDGI